MAIAQVQKNSVLGSGTSQALAFSSPNTLGNFLVLATVSVVGAAAISSVTDSQGNSWVQALEVDLSLGTHQYYIYYAANCKAGANTVTVTYATTGFPIIEMAEYSGVATTSPLDQALGTGSSLGQTSYASGSVTTSQANELLIGFVGSPSGATTTITPDAGWTNELQLRSASVPDIAFLDQIVGAAGAYNNSGTFSNSTGWVAGITTFKGASAPPPPSVGGSWVQFGRDFINKRGLRG